MKDSFQNKRSTPNGYYILIVVLTLLSGVSLLFNYKHDALIPANQTIARVTGQNHKMAYSVQHAIKNALVSKNISEICQSAGSMLSEVAVNQDYVLQKITADYPKTLDEMEREALERCRKYRSSIQTATCYQLKSLNADSDLEKDFSFVEIKFSFRSSTDRIAKSCSQMQSMVANSKEGAASALISTAAYLSLYQSIVDQGVTKKYRRTLGFQIKLPLGGENQRAAGNHSKQWANSKN